jgi:hypothetical protein
MVLILNKNAMKKILLIMMSVTIILSSCKKEGMKGAVKNTAVSGKTYPVKFHLSGVKKSLQTINSLKKNALSDQITSLYYYVFRSGVDQFGSIALFKQKVQNFTDADFGSVTDTLPVGNYLVFFVGTKAPGTVVEENKLGIGTFGLPIFYYNDANIHETFISQLGLNVTDSVTQDVVLTRANALVNVQIADTVPPNAATIKLSFDDFPLGLSLFGGIGDPHGATDTGAYPTVTYTYPISAADQGKPGFTFSALVWSYGYPNIRVDCFDGGENLLASKVITPFIAFGPNTQYTFTGKLFSNGNTAIGNGGSFQVTVDPNWNPPVTLPFVSSYTKSTKKLMAKGR